MKPMISAYRYGSPRQPHEGIRIGSARHVPRGVRREDWQRKNYFDRWVPLLAPTAELVSGYRHGKINFSVFSRRYKSQMKKAESRQIIELLGAIALFQPISVGCFCEDESRCHRSLLRDLILKESKKQSVGFTKLFKSVDHGDVERFASPVCFAQED